MADLAEKLYSLMYDSIPEVDKVCIPLSGGFDSRVLAALYNQKFGQIDLSYTHCTQYNSATLKTAEQIARFLDIKEYHRIEVSEQEIENNHPELCQIMKPFRPAKGPLLSGLKKLNEKHDLSDYTFLVPWAVDVLLGAWTNPQMTLARWIQGNDEHTFVMKYYYYDEVKKGVYRNFACDIINPYWHERMIDFCLSLPTQLRLGQKLYRQMMKRYFPELARIPHDTMNVRPDAGQIEYGARRVWYAVWKLAKKNRLALR